MSAQGIPTSYADGWPGPWFCFGPKFGGQEQIERDGKIVGIYLRGDNRCYLPHAWGRATTAWTCGEWGTRERYSSWE